MNLEKHSLCLDAPKPLDSLKIEGIVEIINGDTHIIVKNKMTQAMLTSLAQYVGGGNSGNISTGSAVGMSTNSPKIYIGIDTITATAYNTTVLQTPIGASPGTAPNSMSGATSNPSNGVFRIVFTATWNAGTVVGTVGEMALYLAAVTPLGAYLSVMNSPSSIQLVSRLAVADGAITPFAINTANPLTVNWTIQFSF